MKGEYSRIMSLKRFRQMLLLTGATGIIIIIMNNQWANPLTINSLQSKQGGRSQNNNVFLNSNKLEQGVIGQMQNPHVRIAVSENKRTDGSQREKSKLGKNHKKRCTVLQLKKKLKEGYDGMTHCKKKRPLTRDCGSGFRDPLSVDIDGACKKSTSKEICDIIGSPDEWIVHCNMSLCNKTVYLGTNKAGTIFWKEYKTRQSLQNSILNLIQTSDTRYCFIACNKFQGHGIEPQLLNLPPPPQRSGLKAKLERKKLINFNFIMIDSVSRTHFFRSLPRSAKVLNTVAAERQDTMVLDFELVQGIRSRTFETLQALFSGYVNPYEVPFGINDLPKEKLNVAKWLLSLRELGFSSLWLEDMCPFNWWGLTKDLLVMNKTLSRNSFYLKFVDAYRKAGIDDIGNTFSNCNILRYNALFTPFTSNNICFNGRHQHEYMFSYLKTFQRTMQHRSEPFISFMTSNIAHELYGEKVMFLDDALAQSLKYSSDLTETLTILFADHGNFFTKHKNYDGRLEVFNPLLFMIIPKAVQSMFTFDQLQALKINQYRLISILDLHYTISYIIRLLQIKNDSKPSLDDDVNDFNKQFNVSKYGLLAEISAKRTCSLIPRIMPNLCICKGYDITSENPSYNYILAVYVVGTMNDDIQRQLLNSGVSIDSNNSHHGGFRNCKRMKLQKIGNVEEHHENDSSKTMKMDLYVETDGQTVEEMFFVTLVNRNSSISMIKYDRMTLYAKYTSCCDKNVDLKICICSSSNERVESKNIIVSKTENAFKSILYSSLQHNITTISVNDDTCLYIIEQFNRDGIVYEAFNGCQLSLALRLFFRPLNINLSIESRVDINLFSGDIKFLAAGLSSNEWSCNVNVEIVF